MKIFPSLEEARRYAASGAYKVLPLSCEMLSDRLTPIECLRILKGVSTHCYLLESAEDRERWGRYTFLGFDPALDITCLDGEMKAGSVRMHTDDPSAVLRQILSDYKSPSLPGLPPFTGGLVGYFAYDYGTDKLDEISLSAPTHICEFKDGWFKSYTIKPEDFGMERCQKSDLKGGTPAENAEITLSILRGEKGHRRNAVLLNAGAGLYLNGKADSLAAGIRLAGELIDSGRATATLEKVIEVSNRPED